MVQVEKLKMRTRTIERKLNPFWCEEFTLYVSLFFNLLFSAYITDIGDNNLLFSNNRIQRSVGCKFKQSCAYSD